jgi:hypothetical protein
MRPPRHTWRATGTAALTVALMSACAFDPSGGAVTGGGDGPGDQLGPDAGRGEVDAALPPTPDAGLAAGTLPSRRVTTPPVIDGEVDALWQQAPAIEYRLQDAAATYGVHPGYGWDASVRARSFHDATRIYFLVEVTDDVLVDDSIKPYDDDAIELYLDGAGDRTGPYGMDDHWLVVPASGAYGSYGPGKVLFDAGFVATTDDGYRVEVSLLRSALGISPHAGAIGFNLGLIDDDRLGLPTADAAGVWFVPPTEACASCCSGMAGAWCDTSRFGTLLLVD